MTPRDGWCAVPSADKGALSKNLGVASEVLCTCVTATPRVVSVKDSGQGQRPSCHPDFHSWGVAHFLIHPGSLFFKARVSVDGLEFGI